MGSCFIFRFVLDIGGHSLLCHSTCILSMILHGYHPFCITICFERIRHVLRVFVQRKVIEQANQIFKGRSNQSKCVTSSHTVLATKPLLPSPSPPLSFSYVRFLCSEHHFKVPLRKANPLYLPSPFPSTSMFALYAIFYAFPPF